MRASNWVNRISCSRFPSRRKRTISSADSRPGRILKPATSVAFERLADLGRFGGPRALDRLGVMRLKQVVLPAPLGPIKPTMALASTEKLDGIVDDITPNLRRRAATPSPQRQNVTLSLMRPSARPHSPLATWLSNGAAVGRLRRRL